MVKQAGPGSWRVALLVVVVVGVALAVVLKARGEKDEAPAAVQPPAQAAPAVEAPDTYEAHMERATRLVERTPERSLSSYAAALELKPGDAEALFGRALARLKLRDAPGAMRDLEGALEAEPTFADAVYLMGEAKRLSGDEAGARGEYERYLELDPEGLYAKTVQERLAGE